MQRSDVLSCPELLGYPLLCNSGFDEVCRSLLLYIMSLQMQMSTQVPSAFLELVCVIAKNML